MSLRNVNLNLVPILLALLKTRSVSRSAEMLGLSQGAASNALARLRETFDDPLLVRVGSHMELTPRAVELLAPTEAQCASLETLFRRPGFDPATARRTFVIAASDYATFTLGSALLAAVAGQARHVKLRFVDVIERLTERMAEREIDVAIVPESFIDYLSPGRLRFAPLVEERRMAMVRVGHPLADRPVLSIADLSPYQSITFHPSSELIERQDATAFMGGYPFEVVAFVPHVTAAPYLLVGTDHFTIVPERIAQRMAKILPLQSRPIDFAIDPIRIGLAWSPLYDTDPAHQWFRDKVTTASQALAPGPWPTGGPVAKVPI